MRGGSPKLLYRSIHREESIAFANIPLLPGLGCVVAAPAKGFAEELQQEFSSDFSDATPTPQQWRQRVEDARRRSEEFVAQARSHTIHSIQSDQKTPN
jgi:hypothetical protein